MAQKVVFAMVEHTLQAVPPIVVVVFGQKVVFQSLVGTVHVYIPAGDSKSPPIQLTVDPERTWDVPRLERATVVEYGAFAPGVGKWAVGSSPPRIIIAPPTQEEPAKI